MEVLNKYVIKILEYNKTREIKGGGGGGRFDSELFRWRKDEENTTETEGKQAKIAKYSLHWHRNKPSHTPEGFIRLI